MSGFHGGFLIALAGCIAAVVIALFIPGIRKPAVAQQSSAQPSDGIPMTEAA
jgi:hypothetical protein